LTVFDTIVRTAALAQTVVRDTVVALPAHEGWRVWVDTLSGIAQIVIALALLAIGVVMMAIAFLLWKVYRQAKAALAKLRIDVDPAVQTPSTSARRRRGWRPPCRGTSRR
jgi:hypothetical protein